MVLVGLQRDGVATFCGSRSDFGTMLALDADELPVDGIEFFSFKRTESRLRVKRNDSVFKNVSTLEEQLGVGCRNRRGRRIAAAGAGSRRRGAGGSGR